MDTSLAESTLKSLDLTTGAIIPPNFEAKKFIHYTCDSIDILDETLDGKNTFYATQMAAWQRSQASDESFKNLQPSVKRALSMPSALEELHPARITPGICTPVFTAPVHKMSMVNPEENYKNALQEEATDLAFYLHHQNKELKPLWTVFNQSLSSDESEQTAVGYLLIIHAPSHDFNTLNTAVKRWSLKEADTRLVLHAIYCQFNTVVMASRDTDVLLLLVYHFQTMSCEHLWMMCGTSKKRRYIPIGHVFNNLLGLYLGCLCFTH